LVERAAWVLYQQGYILLEDYRRYVLEALRQPLE
jgi:hypothetical protein